MKKLRRFDQGQEGMRVKIFYGANATIRAFPLSGSHITRFSMCALSFPNRISTGIGKIQATPTLRGANERSRTATYSPNPLLPLDLHYSIRNVHPGMRAGDVWINARSRGDIPKLLGGLREVYLNVELREAVFRLL